MDFENASNFIINKVKTELPGNLYYHSYNHVMDVLQAANELGQMEGINNNDLTLLKTAVLYHDSGFTKQNVEHEAIGCEIARNTLPQFNYKQNEIESICGMIMATKIPQTPHNLLEKIICDADLDYLGRDDFWVIGNHLFMSLKCMVCWIMKKIGTGCN